MFKKVGFAAALTGAFLVTGAFQSPANAQEIHSQTNSHHKVYHYYVNSNCGSSSQSDPQKYLGNHKIYWGNTDWSKLNHRQQTSTNNQHKEKTPDSNSQQTPKKSQPTQQQQSEELSQYEQQVVKLTNQERTQRGLKPLKVDPTLSKMARDKSGDMAQNHYFSHNSPTYGSPFDMMKQYGISYRTAGENIAEGQRTPQEVVDAWMNSEGHRENILNPNFTYIGVGYVEQGNIWTQDFIGK